MKVYHHPPLKQWSTVAPTPVGAPERASSIRPLSSASREVEFCVRLTPFSFALMWIAIAMMHGMCIGCFGIEWWVYKQIPLSSLASNLELYDVTMSPSNFIVVSNVYGAAAIVHCLVLLEMLVASVWYRNFTFGLASKRQQRSRTQIHNNRGRNQEAFGSNIIHIVNLVVGERGFFGVKGRHFALIYVVRETFETILQSIQAFRMSQFVPRLAVNRFYVLIIVSNCWSTPLINYMFKHKPPVERLLCLIFDIAMDFISTVGVPVVLAIPYWKQYDFEATDFPYLLYWDDFWLVNMINELRIVFVSSWANLFCELTFSVSLLVCLQDVKYLLRPYPTAKRQKKGNRFRPGIELAATFPSVHTCHQLMPIRRLLTSRSITSGQNQNETRSANQFYEATTRFVKIVHIFMTVWGTSLLVLHLRASLRSTPIHCVQRAWPWFGTRSGCTLLRMNCNKIAGSTGNLTEFDAALGRLDEQTLSYIVIRHCSYIEIPTRLQNFHNLVGLKIFNSTIARWDADAALTAKCHPKIVFCFLAQTNMTQVPLGLQSADFPSQLKDIEFAWTNLTTVPDDVGTKWPNDGFVMLERGQLNSVPQGVLRGSSRYISFAGNNITRLPEELFTNPAAIRVWLNANPISELPNTLEPSQSIERMDFSYTQLKSLPSWADAAFFVNTRLNAGGTPLCEQILLMATDIDKTPVPSHLKAAWDAYQTRRLRCTPTGTIFYPYEAEALQDAA